MKIYAVFYLPVLAAEKEALWQKNGLEVEWVSTKGGGAMMRAMAAGALNIGLTGAVTAIKAAAAGVPTVIVANLYPKEPFYIWVRSDSRIKKPKDLSGTKIGVAKYGGMEHVYMQIITKALGLEGKIKVVSVGGLRAVVAGLRSKAIDGAVQPLAILVKLKASGQARELLNTADYLPSDWVDMIVAARKDFVEGKPDTVGKMVKTVFQGVNYTLKNRQWAISQMKIMNGYSDQAASLMFDSLRFSRDGQLSKQGLRNVRDIMIKFGVMHRYVGREPDQRRPGHPQR
ncbi:MAG: ABC transporter substrate-binding protein [Thermodesulfobacteriota bacterium]